MLGNPIKALRRTLLARGVPRQYVPQTKLAQLTAYFVVFALLFGAVDLIGRWSGAKALESFGNLWWQILGDISLVLLVILFFRWIRQRFLWSLRRRLFASYFFIGVIPVVLLLLMAVIVGYLFAGQFATYAAVSEIRKELDTMAVANEVVSEQMAASPAAPEKRAKELVGKGEAAGVTMSVWLDGKPLAAQPGSPTVLPAWVKDSGNIIAVEGDTITLRAITARPLPGGTLVIVSGKDLKQEATSHLAKSFGTFNVWVPDFSSDDQNWDTGQKREAAAKGPRLALSTNKPKSQITDSKGNPRGPTITTGTLPPPTRLIDNEIFYGTPYEMTEWLSGKKSDGLLGGRTRYSVLYPQLFANMSSSATIVLTLLVVAAVVFGIIELVAFGIGVGLSHTMTSSISNLYRATQHIKRADFSHRIEVRGNDQLAELQRAFNTMTEDIEHLIVEQKEKQKLQNELAIAQEVQDQLFPHNPKGLPSLEVHGVCRPARTVSGDYYDFVPFGLNKLGIAVGDISGKGISAALMMATVHSAVRAYEVLGNGSMPAALTAAAMSSVPSADAAAHLARATQSPASALTLLNRHLYETTPLEKYATLFLGIYDEQEHSLLYSNGGHLPPLLVGTDGGVRKLDGASGLMVGLFDHPKWEDASIQLRPGDLFVAFSDGVIEPENEFGEFGTERLLEIVRPERKAPLPHISELVISAVTDWIGANEQPDDITLVLARVR